VTVRAAVSTRPPFDSKNSKQKSPRRISPWRALQFLRCGRYADDLPDMSNRFQAVNKLQKIQRNGFDKLKLLWPIMFCEMETPATIFRRGL